MKTADALFKPTSIALIGASSDGYKNAGRPQRFLKQHGFEGDIFPVNPFRDQVQGVKAYESISDVPARVDHALIMTPASTVADLIVECAQAGVSFVTIYADGFAETGPEGELLQRRLVELATRHNIRLLGPNSMGVINVGNGMALSVNAVLEMPKLVAGRVGVVSQSGTVLGTLLSRGAARGIGFSKLVSVGNECDMSVGEITQLLIEDPDTDVVLLFLEGIRNAEQLAAAAARAHQLGKQIVVYKLGKSEAGRRLAVSHSGALASSARTTDAFFSRHGIVRVEMLESLLEIPLLVGGRMPMPGRRVCVVTTTGGGAAMVADRLGEHGLELIGPSEKVRARLRGLQVEIGAGPLVDLTMAGTRDGVYGAALEELLNDDRCDAVVCVVGSSGQFHPELAVAPIIAAGRAKKFLAVFIAPQAEQSLAQLNTAGIAGFRTPEACADAVAAALAWAPPSPVIAVANPPVEIKSTYDEYHALELFRALGIPVVTSTPVGCADDLPTDFQFPVVAKILSDKIAHKSEVGGVTVLIDDRAALDSAMEAMRTSLKRCRPDISIDQFLVQTMETGITEVLLGYRRDPEVGPVVILGSGGILAEVLDDVAVAVAPLNLAQANHLISQVKGLVVLSGYRGQIKGDLAALAQAIVDISKLAAGGAAAIEEAEINPLLVRAEGQGVVALDGLVRCRLDERTDREGEAF